MSKNRILIKCTDKNNRVFYAHEIKDSTLYKCGVCCRGNITINNEYKKITSPDGGICEKCHSPISIVND